MRNIVGLGGVLAAVLGTQAWAVDLPTLQALQWVTRPIFIFADSPADPRVTEQVKTLEDAANDMEERDVQIFVDTDPAAKSEFRQKFRPRGFSVLLVGKDGQIKYRKPSPVPADEFMRLIDRMPMRQQEMREQGKTLRP